MKNLVNKLNSKIIAAKTSALNFAKSDRGDTNFLSIAIILIVVISVAVVFIGFKDQLLPKLKKAIEEILGIL